MKTGSLAYFTIKTFVMLQVFLERTLCAREPYDGTCDVYTFDKGAAICNKRSVADPLLSHYDEHFLGEECHGDGQLFPNRNWNGYIDVHRLIVGNCTLKPYAYYNRFVHVTSVSVGNRNTTIILRDHTFRVLCRVETMDLSASGIQAIEPLAFDCMNSIQRLDLSNNQIEVLPSRIFSHMRSMTQLDLSLNRIRTLPTAIFHQLESLTHLDLSNNELRTAGNIFSLMPQLVSLDISNNDIAFFSKNAFLGALGLKELNVSGNRLQEITIDAFGALFGVERLALAFNEITELKDGPFRNNGNLFSLDLSGNKLSEMQKGDFRGLKSLLSLKMRSNVVQSIAMNSLDEMPNLLQLDMDSNRLTSLPTSDKQSVFSHPKLWFLSLRSNGLENLSNIFHNSSSIQLLDLSGNPGLSLTRDSLAGLTSLSMLLMDECNVTAFPEGLFENTPKLTNISMRNNYIRAIEPDTFAPLKLLVELDLSHNRIEKLSRSFSFGSKKYINLSNNNIVEIEKGAFSKSIRSLDLSSNFVSYLPLDQSSMEFLDVSRNLVSSLRDIIKPGISLKDVDVSHNHLTEITKEEWREIAGMRRFAATDNSIREITVPEIDDVKHSRVILLERNNVSRVSLPDNIQNLTRSRPWATLKIHISDNAMNCDCSASGLYEYLKHYNSSLHYVEFIGEWICDQPPELHGKNLEDLNQTDLKCDFVYDSSRA